MIIDELDNILNQGEGTRIEFKESRGGVPKDLYETVVSFSNTDGGVIVLGVDDDGKVLGLPEDCESKFIKEIVTTLNNPSCFNPCLFLEPVMVKHPNGNVIVLRVPASSQLHKHNGNVYWRSDDSDQNVTKNQQKISDIYFQKRESFSEGNIFEYLSYEDLDEQLFDKARNIIATQNSTHPWLSMSNQELLSSASLYKKDFKTGESGLTLAAALIFGKDETIHNLLPAYKVDALVRREDMDRHDDRLLLRTNLIDTYLNLLDFIKKHLNDKFYQENGQRKDLRGLIFREVIGNLIVHREYTNAQSSELIIYKHKVTLKNPNKALFHGPLDLKKFTPHPKNPNIRKFFTAFGWTDELGSGVRNTSKYLNLYVPGAEPEFIENSTFVTQIPLISLSLLSYHVELCQWLELSDETSALLVERLTLLSLDPNLVDYDWPTLILHLVPSWNRNGTKQKLLSWPVKQDVTDEEIKKVSGWDEKGTKLLPKKVIYFIKILLLASKPLSLVELMGHINYKNRSVFRENYLLPLLDVEFIQRTDQSAISSPGQKYIITELGKRFLTGKDL